MQLECQKSMEGFRNLELGCDFGSVWTIRYWVHESHHVSCTTGLMNEFGKKESGVLVRGVHGMEEYHPCKWAPLIGCSSVLFCQYEMLGRVFGRSHPYLVVESYSLIFKMQ